MKVIVHHLPTSCKWEVEVRGKFTDFQNSFSHLTGFLFEDTDGNRIIFPADVVAQSVVKVIA